MQNVDVKDSMDAEQSPLGAYHEAVRRHEAMLTDGRRVLVRTTGECPLAEEFGYCGDGDGQIGKVVSWRSAFPSGRHREHVYLVWWAPDEEGPEKPGGGFFAAAELVPLDTGAGAEDGEATASQPSP